MNTDQPKVLACEKCNVVLVPIQKKKAVSIAGLIGAMLFVVGLISLLFNYVVAAVLMILGLLISAVGRSNKTVMVCPQCGEKGRVL